MRYHLTPGNLAPGNLACSSWSSRGWLMLEAFAIDSEQAVAPRTPAMRRSRTASASGVFS